MFTDLHRCILALGSHRYMGSKTDQPRHEAQVDVRTISLVAWSTGPRFDWAVYVCVRACVCVFARVAANVSFSFQCRKSQNGRNDKIKLLPRLKAFCNPCNSGTAGRGVGSSCYWHLGSAKVNGWSNKFVVKSEASIAQW